MAIALAVTHGERAGLGIEVAALEGEGLGDAQTAAVEDGEERTVANAGGRCRRRRAEQGAGLLPSEHLRGQFPARIGRGLPGAVAGLGDG